MIIKEADVLPHALINQVETKLGKDGEILYKYINWLRNRIETYKPSIDYNPVLHIDVYGVHGYRVNQNDKLCYLVLRSFAEGSFRKSIRILTLKF